MEERGRGERKRERKRGREDAKKRQTSRACQSLFSLLVFS
ncbi:hypothetical protein V512_012170 [Mesotoga sp. Brook.08.105.5.1]|nr:hypothetical protein V512_012170 [Mesotoga sp. Brook.08.105.5.1]